MSSLAEVKTPLDHVSDGGMEGDWEAVSSKVIVPAAGTASKYVNVAGKLAAMLSSMMVAVSDVFDNKFPLIDFGVVAKH